MAYLIDDRNDRQIIRAKGLVILEKRVVVWQQLPSRIVNLLLDGLILLNYTRSQRVTSKDELVDLFDGASESYDVVSPVSEIFSDYSMIVAPVYKAFEGYLIFIAKHLGLPVEKYEHKIGGLYNWEMLEESQKEIVEQLSSKFGTADEAKSFASQLSMVLKNYRHNPAHYSGDVIRSLEEAEDYIGMIFSTINKTGKYIFVNVIEQKVRTNREDVY